MAARPKIRTRKKIEGAGGKSQFIDLTNMEFPQRTTGGTFLVNHLLKIVDHVTDPDTMDGWQSYLWSVRCLTCLSETVVERRILKKGKANCPRCEEKQKAEQRKQREAVQKAALEARHRAELEQLELDQRISAKCADGLSSRGIAQALDLKQTYVQSRLRVLGLKTSHTKRHRGLKVPGSLSEEERKHRARVATRITRGIDPLIAHTQGRLKTGPKGPWKHTR